MVRNRVQEALRVSALPRRTGTAPVFVYTRPVFVDENRRFLSQVNESSFQVKLFKCWFVYASCPHPLHSYVPHGCLAYVPENRWEFIYISIQRQGTFSKNSLMEATWLDWILLRLLLYLSSEAFLAQGPILGGVWFLSVTTPFSGGNTHLRE